MNLDGSGPAVSLVSGLGVRCPSSLRLDRPRRALYWVDSQLGLIASLALDRPRTRRVSTIRDAVLTKVSLIYRMEPKT